MTLLNAQISHALMHSDVFPSNKDLEALPKIILRLAEEKLSWDMLLSSNPCWSHEDSIINHRRVTKSTDVNW